MSNPNKGHTQTKCRNHKQDMTEHDHFTQSLQRPSRHIAADLGGIPGQHAQDGMALMTCGLSPSDRSKCVQSSVLGAQLDYRETASFRNHCRGGRCGWAPVVWEEFLDFRLFFVPTLNSRSSLVIES